MIAEASHARTYACYGSLPAWSLDIDSTRGTFHLDRTVTMDIMHEALAEGQREWPRALTLVGERDTAIVLLEAETCMVNHTQFPFQAQVLTQKGTVPILLTGCCERRE
jgi:hypothetical protein